MALALYHQNWFCSYVRFNRLEESLGKPEDKKLLNDVLLEFEKSSSSDSCLLAIWSFAMTMGGARTLNYHAWAVHTVNTSEDHQCPGVAELLFPLLPNLHNHEDKQLLIDCLAQYSQYGDQQPLWAIWEFAKIKGEQSAKRWQMELSAKHQKIPARKPARCSWGFHRK